MIAAPHPPRTPRHAWLGAVVLAAIATSLVVGLLAGPEGQRLGETRSGDADLGRRVTAAVGAGAGFRSLVVAEVTADSVVWAGLGNAGDGRRPGRAPQPDDRYELGSVTKTFTAALFADAITRGEVRADDPLARHLPELVDSPAGSVTLASLAQHGSGLPALGATAQGELLSALLNQNPYHTTDTAQLVADATIAPVDPTQPPTYSNLGLSLLGTALTRAAGASDYPALVAERITGPLGMDQTSFATEDSDVPAQALNGFGSNGTRAPRWSGTGYLPSGTSTFTSVTDLARWAQAQLAGSAPGRSALDPTADFGEDARIGWVWLTSPGRDGRSVLWHNGATGGFRTMVAIDREAGRAVVVLGNSTRGVDALAISLLYGDSSHQPLPSALPAAGWVVTGAALLLGVAAVWRTVRRRSWVPVASAVLGGVLGLLLLWFLGPWEQVGGWLWGLVAAPTLAAVGLGVVLAARSGNTFLPERRRALAIIEVVAYLAAVVIAITLTQ